jgi:hypothetical protein
MTNSTRGRKKVVKEPVVCSISKQNRKRLKLIKEYKELKSLDAAVSVCINAFEVREARREANNEN